MPIELAFFVELALDLKQVGEVGRRLQPDLEVDGLLVVIEQQQFFVKPFAQRAFPDGCEVGIDIDSACSQRQKVMDPVR